MKCKRRIPTACKVVRGSVVCLLNAPHSPQQSLLPLAEPPQSYRADNTWCGQGRGKHLMPCSAHEVSPSLEKKET